MRRIGTVALALVFLVVSLIPTLTHPSPAYANTTVPLPVPEDPLGQQPEQSVPEITVHLDVRDGHLVVRVVDIWGPGRTPLVVRSYTNAEPDPAYKPDIAAPLYTWFFNYHLDIIGTDVLEPDGNRSVYRYSSDRWNGTSELFQVYVKSVGTYSTLEMRYTCTPPPEPPCPRCERPSTRPRQVPRRPAAAKPGIRIQGSVQPAPSNCTWDGTHTVFLPKGVVRRYQGGKIVEERDANGNTTSFAYTTFADGTGKYLSTVTDPVGRQTTYINEPGFQKCVRRDMGFENKGECLEFKWVYRVRTVRDAYGRTATYTYDGASKIIGVTNAAGYTTSYGYTSINLLGSVSNARGHATTLQWAVTNNWRVISVTAPGGATTQYAYVGTRTIVTNARGHPTTYDMYVGEDPAYIGNLERVTDPLGNVTQYAYDARHNVTQVTDPRGNRTTYQYNGRNKVTQIVQAAGTLNLTTALNWDDNDNLLSVTNPRGIRTDYAYNGTHNLTSVRRSVGTADESLTQYGYTSWGGVSSMTDPRSNTTTFGYTLRRQLQTVTPPAGGGTAYGYNSVDDQVTVTNGNGRVWTTAYNPARLVTSVTDPLNNVIRHEYDANGNRTRTYDAKNQPTTFAYDSRDRVTSITNPLNGVTRYEYDSVSNLMRVINARTHATTLSYDAANRLTQVTDALLQATTYSYDAAGNRTSMRDRKGATHSYAYDQVNRLTQVSAGGLTVSHAYDANGNRTSMTDGNGTTNYTYDALDRLTRTTTPDGRFVAYAYDRNGNRTRLTHPDGSTTLTYAYDAANRLAQITQGTLNWTLLYDPAGNRTAIAQPNGTRTDYAYLTNNWLQSIIHKRPDGSTFQSFTYGYDANGNRVSQADGTGTTTFTYDVLNRLTTGAYPGTYGSWSWIYDAVGNRTSQTAPGGTTTYTYDANNRLISAGAVNYSYDANGNLTGTTAGQSFSWDVFNRLTRASGSGGFVDYTYNGDGLKVRRAGPEGGATVYYYDGIRPIWEADGAGALKVQPRPGHLRQPPQ